MASTDIGTGTVSASVSTSSVGTGATPSVLASRQFFYAKCGATDAIGAAVYANTTLAYVSSADAANPYPVVGFIVAKSSATDCTVQRSGTCGLFTNLTPNARYFLGSSGGIAAPPFPSNAIAYVQQVGIALSPTQFFIQPIGSVVQREVDNSVETAGPVLAGAVDPTNDLGQDGELYLNKTTATLFGPKVNGVWPTPGIRLMGPPGAPGPQGIPGLGFVYGQGAPPAQNDFPAGTTYVDTLANQIYYPAD